MIYYEMKAGKRETYYYAHKTKI